MASRYMKRYQTSLILKEMQINTPIGYHLTTVRKAIIKNINDNKYRQGCRKEETFAHRRWECNLVQPNWDAVWQFFKIELPARHW
jgi:hypothetical protein